VKNHDSRFDIDLKYGQHVEDELLKALQGKIEVKAERNHWMRTGNIAVEYWSRGKPSGINVTEADHWAQALMVGDRPYCYLVFPTNVLRGMTRYYKDNRPDTVRLGGDDNTSEMILMPLKEIIKPKYVGFEGEKQNG
jgi:hypothetical protein